MKDVKEKVISTVKDNNPDSMGFFIAQIREGFMDGDLYTVVYKISSDPDNPLMNYVFFDGDKFRLYRNDAQLLDMVALWRGKKSFMEQMLSVNGVSGLIAFTVTLLIAYLVINTRSQLEIPEILTNALTVILGFYFGQATKNNKS